MGLPSEASFGYGLVSVGATFCLRLSALGSSQGTIPSCSRGSGFYGGTKASLQDRGRALVCEVSAAIRKAHPIGACKGWAWGC